MTTDKAIKFDGKRVMHTAAICKPMRKFRIAHKTGR